MKICIVGSRSFKCDSLVEKDVRELVKTFPKSTILLNGGAKGVDTWAHDAAVEHGITHIARFFPDWDRYGKSAGFIRNRAMIKKADKVYAFWDGQSKGTQHSFQLCKELNIPIEIFTYK